MMVRWIVPLEHQMPEPSSLALSARNMMICLRAALPKRRSAHSFAIRQLIGPPHRSEAMKKQTERLRCSTGLCYCPLKADRLFLFGPGSQLPL